MKLSLIIPTLPKRKASFDSLVSELNRQTAECKAVGQVEILSDDDEHKTIGKKCNELLSQASGEYVNRLDDDDEVYRHYIRTILKGIESGADVLSFKGVITFDGENPKIFEHSIKYPAYKTNATSDLNWFQWVCDSTGPVAYERFPNHLSTMKTSIAKQFTYPEINHGEDTLWATKVYESGLLKTEYYIPQVLYHYKYVSNK